MAKVTFVWPYPASHVEVTGEYDNWKNRTVLKKNKEGKFSVEMNLLPGTYDYKFVVDEAWCYDVARQFHADGRGNINNYIEVGEIPTPAPSSLKIVKSTTSSADPSPSKMSRESSEDSESPQEPRSNPDESPKAPPGIFGIKFNKITHRIKADKKKGIETRSDEKAMDTSKKAPIEEKKVETSKNSPKKPETDSDAGFKSSRIKFFQNAHDKMDGSWTSSKLDSRKVWKEKSTSATLELTKSSHGLITLQVTKGGCSAEFPPQEFSKLGSKNACGWSQGEGNSKKYYAVQFLDDKEFDQFMEIASSTLAKRKVSSQ